jgi:hypothetical protein
MTESTEDVATLTRVELAILSVSRLDEFIAELGSMVVARDIRQVAEGWRTVLDVTLSTNREPTALIHSFGQALSGLSEAVRTQWNRATSKRFNLLYACRDLDGFRAPADVRKAAAGLGADVVFTTYLARPKA